MESNQPTMCAGSDPLMDKELQQSYHPPENWFCKLPDNVRSQVLKHLDRKTIRVLLKVKSVRDLVLSEPDCWRNLRLRITSWKSAEMAALARVADFAHMVTVEIERFDPEQIMFIISRLPQFHNVVEMGSCSPSRPKRQSLSAESCDSDCDVMLALADHFLKIETLKVPSRFIGYEKSFYHALEQKWTNLQEVEIGVDLDIDGDWLDGIVESPCGFAEGVAESGRLTALRFCLLGQSEHARKFVRNTLMILANGGHNCLRCLYISVIQGFDISDFFEKCLPFFMLNSLTTLSLVRYHSFGIFTTHFIDVLASMTNLKVLVLRGILKYRGQAMMRLVRSSRFELKELSLSLRHLSAGDLDPLLLAIAETQKHLEKILIVYCCGRERKNGLTGGVSALENLSKMKDCQIKCSRRRENFHDHEANQSCEEEEEYDENPRIRYE